MTSERTPGLLTPTSGVGDRSWRNYGPMRKSRTLDNTSKIAIPP